MVFCVFCVQLVSDGAKLLADERITRTNEDNISYHKANQELCSGQILDP